MAFRIAIANQKGGVGKTTTAVNLAASLAQRDYRVCLLDLDPQGNASTGLGVAASTHLDGSYALFASEADSTQPVPTPVPGLTLLPASMSLAGIDVELAAESDRAVRLRARLDDKPLAQLDILILDCPPSFGLLTVNALVAAHAVLVPLQCEFFALEGLAHLTRSIDSIRRAYNPQLHLLGILLTMYDRRNNLTEMVAADVRSFFGGKVLDTVIPRNVKLTEAPSHGLPIALYDPRSAGAIAYEALATELIGLMPTQVQHA